MKVIQQTTTLLECKRSNWIALITAFVLTFGGATWFAWALVKGQGNFAWLGGLIVLAIGVITLLVTRSTTLSIDKSLKRVIIQRYNPVRGTQESTIPFADLREVVVDAQLHHKRSSSNNNEPREMFRYHLIFQQHNGNQEAIDITPASSTTVNGFSTDRFEKNNKVMELGNRIATFIGVPCIDRRAPTFGEAANLVENVLSTIRAGQKPK
jgi:hypothetical protein